MEVKFTKLEIDRLIHALALAAVPATSDVDDKLFRKLARYNTPIKPASAKSKGRNFQKWVCQKLADLLGVNYEQGNDDCPIHSREMGVNGTDIAIRGELRKVFPFDVECKASETLSIPAWIEQAKANTAEGREMMLVFKKQSLNDVYVLMSWDSFENLWKGWQ